ncbi:MAG: hypothetical protein RMK20_15065 [Verrucomicrobiales bacterium]|nr:hypothetical protein [Verrucomicrobiales bacterium]
MNRRGEKEQGRKGEAPANALLLDNPDDGVEVEHHPVGIAEVKDDAIIPRRGKVPRLAERLLRAVAEPDRERAERLSFGNAFDVGRVPQRNLATPLAQGQRRTRMHQRPQSSRSNAAHLAHGERERSRDPVTAKVGKPRRPRPGLLRPVRSPAPVSTFEIEP